MARLVGGPTMEFIKGRLTTIFGASGLLMSTMDTESLPGGRRIVLPVLSNVSFSSLPMIMSWAWATSGTSTKARASTSVWAMDMRNSPSPLRWIRLGPDDFVGEHADLFDLRLHAIPGLEEIARGRPHAVGRARGDDVAGEDGHGEGEDLDAVVDGEDHLAGVARLPHLPVHAHHDVEGLGIGQFVGRHQHGTHGAEGVEGLALEPLGMPLLEIARGDVVDDGVAELVLQGVRATDVVPARPDDHGQLHLVVELARHRVVHHVVAGADHRRARLGEVHGMLGNGGPALRRVIGIVAAEAEHVAGGVRDGGEEAHALEWIGELAPGQVFDGLLLHELLAVLPCLAGEGEGGLAPLDHLEETPREAPAAAPHRPPLYGQLPGETSQVEDGLVPHGARLGLAATATERHEAHGY